MAQQNSFSLCALNRGESSRPQPSCLSLERRVPAPQRPRNHLTLQLPVGTRRSLPPACRCLRSRCRELGAETNPWGPVAAISYLTQLGLGNPVAENRSVILSPPH